MDKIHPYRKEKDEAKSEVIKDIYYKFYQSLVDVEDDKTLELEFGHEVLDVIKWTEKAHNYREKVIKRVEKAKKKGKKVTPRVKGFADFIREILSKL